MMMAAALAVSSAEAGLGGVWDTGMATPYVFKLP